jgi:hypothetical protein
MVGREADRAVQGVMDAAMAAVMPGDDVELVERQGDQEARRAAARAACQRRVATGEYGELFDAPVRSILMQAGKAAGLAQEMGALRYVLARVLAEEEDPVRQALGVSRVTSAAARVARVRETQREEPDAEVQRYLQSLILDPVTEQLEREEIRRAERVAGELGRRRLCYGCWVVGVGGWAIGWEDMWWG